MMQLTISSTYGQIGIEQSPWVMRMTTTPPKLETEIKNPKMSMSIDWSAVHIDLGNSLASMGYKSHLAFGRELVGEAKSAAHAGTKKTAREGDRLGDLAAGGKPFQQIAAQVLRDKKETNVAAVPKTPPEISFAGGLKIETQPGEVGVKAQTRSPEVSASHGGVSVYLKIKPSIDIEVSGSWINISV